MSSNIKKARELAGYSQKYVALVLGVSAPTVSDWESGKTNPNANNLRQLSKLFSVSIDFLLGNTNIPSFFTESSDSFSHIQIVSREPVNILSCQYRITSEMMATILDVNRTEAEQWTNSKNKLPNESIARKLSVFFEISYSELMNGILPLYTKESVWKKVNALYLLHYPTIEEHDRIPYFEDRLNAYLNGLLTSYRQLNDEGQEKLVEYADDLVQSGKYIKSDPSLLDQEA